MKSAETLLSMAKSHPGTSGDPGLPHMIIDN